MKKFNIPDNLIEEFLEVSGSNFAKDSSKHVETLALVIGHESRSAITVSHLVFPDQECHSDYVIDRGKNHFLNNKILN